jgi:2,3,4,5-tetrahydropyridine-2-carboxylate N-succinyltransferase
MSDRPTGAALLDALESGEVRAAHPTPDGWVVDTWVKEGILALFRASDVVAMGAFRDKAPLTTRTFDATSGVRLVPGGSAVRRGAYLAPGVVCMPPMYVNVGAWIGAGSMIDSHALVGSCAQVGEGVHVSAAAQLGGVLEPAGARPVIVEDGAFIGGNTGVYEGVRVGARAVLAAGVVLTAGTRLFDLVHERELTGTSRAPLEVPAGAVVVPGARPVRGAFAAERGLHAACALIVKYRDERTDAATAIEDALR